MMPQLLQLNYFLKDFKLKKSIFITGAASGIGRATAILFANKGWNVGLFDINEEGLESVAKEIGHNACMYQKLDVTKIDEWQSAKKNFSDFTGGTCDLFFNNAGIANFAGKFEDIPLEEMNKIIDVNFKGVVNGCLTMLDLLKNTDNSVLLNTCSIAGLVPAPGISVYGATKFAVRGLTESLRIEFDYHNVRVSEINPWFTDTPILDAKRASDDMESPWERDFVNERTKIYPVEQVANAVWHSYTNKRIHNPLGFEGKFSSFFMNLCPSLIRFLSKRMFKDTFLN